MMFFKLATKRRVNLGNFSYNYQKSPNLVTLNTSEQIGRPPLSKWQCEVVLCLKPNMLKMLLTRATSTTTKAASSAVAIVNQVLIQQIIYSSKRQTNACQHVARGPILENVAILKRTTLTVQHFVAKVTGRFEQIVAQCLQNIAQNQPKAVFSRELKILTHFQYCHKLAKHSDN